MIRLKIANDGLGLSLIEESISFNAWGRDAKPMKKSPETPKKGMKDTGLKTTNQSSFGRMNGSAKTKRSFRKKENTDTSPTLPTSSGSFAETESAAR
jgi:hypothetical protein